MCPSPPLEWGRCHSLFHTLETYRAEKSGEKTTPLGCSKPESTSTKRPPPCVRRRLVPLRCV
eukprot:3654542-Pleurochrysis_carterae.AAC.4